MSIMSNVKKTLPERIDAAIDRIKNGGLPMQIPANEDDADIVLHDCGEQIAALELQLAEARQRNIRGVADLRGCLYAGAGRGDCEHFVGLKAPERDEYGRPYGWCEICWRGETISTLQNELRTSQAEVQKWQLACCDREDEAAKLEAQLAEARQQNEKLKAARAEAITGFVAAQNTLREVREKPIDMVLFCPNPKCGAQHIDAPDERTPGWTNPPHRKHLCHVCGTLWRPANVATNGVLALELLNQDGGSK